MDGLSLQLLVQTFGPAGMFIAYLLYDAKQDRDAAEKRRQADIQLALALDRFCRRYAGQPWPDQGGERDVHQG